MNISTIYTNEQLADMIKVGKSALITGKINTRLRNIVYNSVKFIKCDSDILIMTEQLTCNEVINALDLENVKISSMLVMMKGVIDCKCVTFGDKNIIIINLKNIPTVNEVKDCIIAIDTEYNIEHVIVDDLISLSIGDTNNVMIDINNLAKSQNVSITCIKNTGRESDDYLRIMEYDNDVISSGTLLYKTTFISIDIATLTDRLTQLKLSEFARGNSLFNEDNKINVIHERDGHIDSMLKQFLIANDNVDAILNNDKINMSSSYGNQIANKYKKELNLYNTKPSIISYIHKGDEHIYDMIIDSIAELNTSFFTSTKCIMVVLYNADLERVANKIVERIKCAEQEMIIDKKTRTVRCINILNLELKVVIYDGNLISGMDEFKEILAESKCETGNTSVIFDECKLETEMIDNVDKRIKLMRTLSEFKSLIFECEPFTFVIFSHDSLALIENSDTVYKLYLSNDMELIKTRNRI